MSRRFRRGLVAGKFSPLHRGHEAVIRQALADCEAVFVISYSKPEMPRCEAAQRTRWFQLLFPEVQHLAVTDEWLKESIGPGAGPRELPHNDAEATIHRQFCGALCLREFGGPVEAVFTSEDYGDEFAKELTTFFRARQPGSAAVKHVMVDRERCRFPISGSELRRDAHALRRWLSPQVYASFVKRVCLLGGESSGKSTLAAALAHEFSTLHVAEFGREAWERQRGDLVFEDMLRIAAEQIEREEAATLRSREFLFCDTTPLTTLFYGHYLFGRVAPSLELLASRPYDFTFLCAPDFPFQQDGTRRSHEFRMLQHEWYRRELKKRGIRYELLRGSLEERIASVTKALRAE